MDDLIKRDRLREGTNNRWPERDHGGRPITRSERKALKSIQDIDMDESLRMLKGIAWGTFLSLFFWIPLYLWWVN